MEVISYIPRYDGIDAYARELRRALPFSWHSATAAWAVAWSFWRMAKSIFSMLL